MLTLFLLLVGCDDCAPDDVPPTCTVSGQDSSGAPSDDVYAVFGFQGGMHLNIDVAVETMTNRSDIVVEILDGEEVIGEGQMFRMTGDGTCGGAYRTMEVRFYDMEAPCGLADQSIQLRATVPRADGQIATCTNDVTLTLEDWVLTDMCPT